MLIKYQESQDLLNNRIIEHWRPKSQMEDRPTSNNSDRGGLNIPETNIFY